MRNVLDGLLKSDGSSPVKPSSKRFIYSKAKMKRICCSLSTETKNYIPQKTIESISGYLKAPDKIDRILYSEISNYVYSLNTVERGVFATNVEKLLLFTLDNSNINMDCRKIVIKIYDHFQLVLYQIENVNNIFTDSIENVRNNIKNEIKGIEKEYISILGIFAAIVLAFVGGITFSSSVLQNISGVSIYRLILIVDLLAFVLINVIYLLIHFIFIINDKDIALFKIKWTNLICFCVAAATVCCWLFNVQALSNFISQFLPWC